MTVVEASLSVTDVIGPKPGPSPAPAEALEVTDPVALPIVAVAGAGEGKFVRLPSTLIAPPLAEAGIPKV